MKLKYLLSILFILFSVTLAAASPPTLKISLDEQGYAHLKPTLPAGTSYDLQLFAVDATHSKIELTWVEPGTTRAKHLWFSLPLAADVAPDPNPNPGPTPDPVPPTPGPNPPTPPVPPAPVAQKCFFVTIYESAETTQDFALCQVSPKIRDYCKAGGHQTFFLDKDAKGPDGQPPKGYAKWLLMAVGRPLPYTIVADAATGQKVLNGDGKGEPAPANEEAMLKYFQKFGGVNSAVPSAVPAVNNIPTVTRPACVNGGCQ